LVLRGPEVKSLREGKVGFQDAFARVEGGEVWLHSLHISPYEQANRFNEDPLRPRKLLLHRQEILRLIGKVEEKGLTLIPLAIYFRRGYAKMTLALARGRKTYDKREKLKRKTQEDEARRAMAPYR
jgi:SsrA-binding protein